MALKALPSKLTIVDVETTGLSADDRIVSLGILHFEDVARLAAGSVEASATHLVFNPGRPSHPRARKVHGYSDAYLANQDPFASHAKDLRGFFDHEGVVVAHNASFDRRFIVNEFHAAEQPLKRRDFHCTMLQHRRVYGSPSGLDAVLSQMGYPPRTGLHGALQDAWCALAVYCWLHELPVPALSSMPKSGPLNARDLGTAPAPLPTPPSAPPLIIPPLSNSLYAASRNRMLPLATVMMAVARADGSVFATEVESVSLLIDTMLSGTDVAEDLGLGARLLEELIDLDPQPADLDAACDAIIADPHQKNAVSGWIRQITYADGQASDREAGAVLKIADHLRGAHARRRALGAG